MLKITDQEYKDLILSVAKSIAPEFVKEKQNSFVTSKSIALYSKHIADEVAKVIENPDYDLEGGVKPVKFFYLQCRIVVEVSMEGMLN